jgi:hypothetical protein
MIGSLLLGQMVQGIWAKTALPDGMLAAGSGVVAAAHYVGLFAVGVTALEHSASTSGIAARASSTEGAASTLASATSSSMGVGRTG